MGTTTADRFGNYVVGCGLPADSYYAVTSNLHPNSSGRAGIITITGQSLNVKQKGD